MIVGKNIIIGAFAVGLIALINISYLEGQAKEQEKQIAYNCGGYINQTYLATERFEILAGMVDYKTLIDANKKYQKEKEAFYEKSAR